MRTVVFRGFLGPIESSSSQNLANGNGNGPAADPSLPVPSRDSPQGAATSDLVTFCTDCRSEKVRELMDGNGRAQVAWWVSAFMPPRHRFSPASTKLIGFHFSPRWFSVTKEQYRLSGRVYLVFPPSHALYSSTPLPPIPFPASTANPPVPTDQDVKNFWEQQRLALWGRIAPGGRASFTWAAPGEPLTQRCPEDRQIWELDDLLNAPDGTQSKEAHDLGLSRFTMLVFEVDSVDYLKLGGRPQSRIKFASRNGGWEEWDVNP